MVAGSPLADPQGVGQPAERPLVAGQRFGDDPVRHPVVDPPALHQVALAVAAIP
jgi:hypothetical protein